MGIKSSINTSFRAKDTHTKRSLCQLYKFTYYLSKGEFLALFAGLADRIRIRRSLKFFHYSEVIFEQHQLFVFNYFFDNIIVQEKNFNVTSFFCLVSGYYVPKKLNRLIFYNYVRYCFQYVSLLQCFVKVALNANFLNLCHEAILPLIGEWWWWWW